MKGLWKNKVGGYNHKGDRRKSQKTKHMFKENGRIILKKFDKDSTLVHDSTFRKEKELELVYKETRKVHYNAKVFNCFVHALDKIFYCKMYIDENLYGRNKYIDYKTNESLYKVLGLTYIESYRMEISSVRYTNIEVQLNFQKTIDDNKVIHRRYFHEEEYLYGIKFENYMYNLLYTDGKRRKIGQSLVNRSRRMYERCYVNNEDWDVDVKRNKLDKSLEWYIS